LPLLKPSRTFSCTKTVLHQIMCCVNNAACTISVHMDEIIINNLKYVYLASRH